MAISVAALLLLAALFAVGILLYFVFAAFRTYAAKARDAGLSLGEYLRATPRTDQERGDAVDLALRGLVVCVLGLLLPPLLIIGVFPLYYGARKLAFASMGFGLVDDPESPGG